MLKDANTNNNDGYYIMQIGEALDYIEKNKILSKNQCKVIDSWLSDPTKNLKYINNTLNGLIDNHKETT